jgi:hypothetical protein
MVMPLANYFTRFFVTQPSYWLQSVALHTFPTKTLGPKPGHFPPSESGEPDRRPRVPVWPPQGFGIPDRHDEAIHPVSHHRTHIGGGNRRQARGQPVKLALTAHLEENHEKQGADHLKMEPQTHGDV